MQQWEMLSKAIRYQKAASDNAFSIISIFQNSGERMLRKTLDQYSWIPEKGKKDCLSWSNNYLQVTAKMKAYVDKGYEEAERLFERKAAREQKQTPAQHKDTQASAQAPKQTAATLKTAAAKRKGGQTSRFPAQKAAATAEKVSEKTASVAVKGETAVSEKASSPKEEEKPQEKTPEKSGKKE
jgi:hypothetical protein